MIRLQDLRWPVGLSQSHFSHAFKASTKAPHQWQLKARIEQGQRLLAAGDRSLTEVAVEAGFSDQCISPASSGVWSVRRRPPGGAARW